MACRGKDIPGRPNNKTKAGGGRQVGREGEGGGKETLDSRLRGDEQEVER